MLDASKIRTTHIIEELEDFTNKFFEKEHYEAEIKNTLFEEYVKSADIEQNELKRFAFSSYITKKILYKYGYSITYLEDLFFLSKVVEHGYYKLNTDFRSSKLKNLLSVSKEFGVFYTPIGIAREMAVKVVEGSSSKIIIDPCCGTGNLLGACLEYAANKNIQLKKIVGIEIDTLSAEVCKKSLENFSTQLGLSVEIEIINKDALSVFSEQGEIFGFKLPIGSIIINPPYGKLKFDSDNLSNVETKLDYQDLHKNKKQQKHVETQIKVKKILNGLESGKGILEWSKIFLTLCIRYLSAEETLVYIGPCGWLNSPSYNGIREKIQRNKLLSEIHFISEDSTGFDTVNQSLSIVSFKYNSKNIEIQNGNSSKENLSYNELIKLKNYGYAIPRVDIPQIQIFLKLQQYKKIKDIEDVKNLRGELDQSLNKNIFSNKQSQLKIIRGENFGRFVNYELPKDKEYFADVQEFELQIGNKPKGLHCKRRRIVGRQCSYMRQKRRLVFNVCPKDYVVGNSCNYLLVPDEDIYYYLGLLNSALFDWYFRVMNGNNHVANYEIDDFPIPINEDELKKQVADETLKIIELASKANYSGNISYFNFENNLDSIVMKSFGLTKDDARIILSENHNEEYIKSVIQLMSN